MSDMVLAIKLVATDGGMVGQVRVSREELKKLGEAHEKAAKSTKEHTSAAVEFVKGLVGYDVLKLATQKIVDYVKEAGLLAARYETLGVVMGVVGRNAGYSAREMDLHSEAVRRSGITMIESRESVIRLAQANIDLSHSQRLARLAQDAAVIGNINSSEALGRLIYGIQSAQTDVLRTIGINVNFEGSYRALAKQLGVTTESLTEQQKAQARVNAVYQAGEGILGSYEAAMGTAGKMMTSLARYTDDLKVLRGQIFNEALVIAVNSYTDSLKEANTETRRLSEQGKLKEWGRDMIMTFAWVGDTIRASYAVFATAIEQSAVLGLRTLNTFAQGARMIVPGGRLLDQLLGSPSSAINEYIDAFAVRAGKNAVERSNMPWMRDEAREFFVRQDADAAERAQARSEDDRDIAMSKLLGVQVGRGGAAGAASGDKKGLSPYQSLMRGIAERTAVSQMDLDSQAKLTEGQKFAMKIMTDLRDGYLKLDGAQKLRLKTALEEMLYTEQANLADQERKKLLEESAKAYFDQVEARQKNVESILDQAEAVERESMLFGKSRTQLLDYEIAQLRSARATREAAGATTDELEALNRLIRGKGEYLDVLRNDDLKQATQRVIDEEIAGQKRAADEINRSLTDALLRGFESGKSFGRNFFKTLANMAQTTILRPLIQPVVEPLGQLGASLSKGLRDALGIGGGASDAQLAAQAAEEAMVPLDSFGPVTRNAKGGIMTSRGPMPLRRYRAGGVANSPQVAMFGEGDVPEAYVPLPDGRRIPVAMQGGAGGLVLNYNPTVNIDARGATPGVEQQLRGSFTQMLYEHRKQIAGLVEAHANSKGRRLGLAS